MDTPYFFLVDTDYNKIKSYQKASLEYCTDNGFAVRDAGIAGDLDFDTKEYVWKTWVRAIKEETV